MEAFDALAAVIEVKWVVTFAYPLRQVELPSAATGLALVGSRVVDLIDLAAHASLSVEERLGFGTENAGLELRVIDLRLGAAQALFLLQVEKLGQVALNAL